MILIIMFVLWWRWVSSLTAEQFAGNEDALMSIFRYWIITLIVVLTVTGAVLAIHVHHEGMLEAAIAVGDAGEQAYFEETTSFTGWIMFALAVV